MNIVDLLNGMTLPPVVACIYAPFHASIGRLAFLGVWVGGSSAGTVDALLGHAWMSAAGGVISLTIALYFWFSHRHRERVAKLLGAKARAVREALVRVMRRVARPNPALRPATERGTGVSTCETHYEESGRPCHAEAIWHVQVGTRNLDGQDLCACHLSATCQTLLRAENHPLTVTR